MSPDLSAITEESPLGTSVVKFETLVYFQPTDDDGNGVFRFELIPRFTESGSMHGGMPPKKSGKQQQSSASAAPASAASASAAPAPLVVGSSVYDVTASGGENTVHDPYGRPIGPIQTFDAITKHITFSAVYQNSLLTACEGAVAGPKSSIQIDLPDKGQVSVRPLSGIYVDWDRSRGPKTVDAHASIHFLDLVFENNPNWEQTVAAPAPSDGCDADDGDCVGGGGGGEVVYIHKQTGAVQKTQPIIPRIRMESEHLDTNPDEDLAKAGSTHFKYKLKTTQKQVCCGIQWELSITIDPSTTTPLTLNPADFKVSLSHNVVDKGIKNREKQEKKGETKGNFVQTSTAVRVCEAVAKCMTDVGQSARVFDDFSLDSFLKTRLMRKAVADCIFKGHDNWSSTDENHPFNVLGLEQTMKANALKGEVTIAMVLEEDGLNVRYNPVACIEVNSGILKSGMTIPRLIGVRIRADGNYGEEITVHCAFDRSAINKGVTQGATKRTMPKLLAEIAESIDQREMYPVRRPTLEEETSLKHILGHPPSKLMQALEAIKQTHAAEVSEAVAFREAAAAAEHQEAAAAAATAAKSDNLVIFEEIFKYVKQNGRLPWTANDVGQVCAQILASHGRNISPESVNEVLQKIADRIGLKQPVKGKIDQVLKAHKTLNETAYASARESAEDILKK
jgi:hypothetical protein